MVDRSRFARPKLLIKEYRTVSYASGPLIVVQRVTDAAYREIVRILLPDGSEHVGQVLEVDDDRLVVQMFASTRGLDLARTRVVMTGDVARLPVARSMIGRVFNGAGVPIDGGPPLMPEASPDINGQPINPCARDHPADFIETGISAIDGLNTLVRGQKLPIFSGFGLPANELVAQIATQAMAPGDANVDRFVVIFAAIGITQREAAFFQRSFEASGALDRSVLFLNLANDPAVERLLTPRAALTAAEHLAFVHDMHVLVILTDMTNYAEALREVATAREEVPGRRGYPGYLYTDLATIYERAGRIRGRPGSITQLVVVTMPDDDITHPIPDLTGYITEGQIVLSRALHQRGIVPPIAILPSLSRLMNAGIGPGKTRADHRQVADQLYAFYAEGQDLRRLAAIVGEGALTAEDRLYLEFADAFEREFVHQGTVARSLDETLDIAWRLLARFPASALKRIDRAFIQQYYPKREKVEGSAA